MSLATIVAMMLTIAVLIEGTEMQENSSANVPEQHEDSAQEDPGIGKGLLYKAIERVAARRQKGYWRKTFEDGYRTFLCVEVKRSVIETSCNRHESHERTRERLRYQFHEIISNDFSMFEWQMWNNKIDWVEYFCCTAKPEEPEEPEQPEQPEEPEQPEQQLPERH